MMKWWKPPSCQPWPIYFFAIDPGWWVLRSTMWYFAFLVSAAKHNVILFGECCKAQCDTLLFNWTCSGIGDQWPLTFLQNTLWSLQICPRTICHLFKWICTMRKKVEKCTAGQSTWTLFSKQCCEDLDKWWCCFSWFVVRFCLSLQLPVEKIPNLVKYQLIAGQDCGNKLKATAVYRMRAVH